MNYSAKFVRVFISVILLIWSFLFIEGSCIHHPAESISEENIYPVDSNLVLLTELPTEVDESSGLLLVGGHIWTQNDSGDDPVLYQIAVNREELKHQIKLENAFNKDWEDLAQDERFIYVGDFGNNGGNRRDLSIYKFPKRTLGDDSTQEVETIHFSYPDQSRFNYLPYTHNFDCEAMICLGDRLYLFSKNHQDKRTKLYSLPKASGAYLATLEDEFNSDGTITAAAVDKFNEIVALVGYNFDSKTQKFSPFVWLFYEYPGRDFFNGKAKRIDFPLFGQMEGICFFGNERFFISTESKNDKKGKLFLFDAKKWLD